MDKKKSLLNVCVSVGFKILTTVMVILVRRLLIRVCGNEVNGLNALYLSIVGFLAVAELGVGSAITFCMYKPIVEGDHQKVSALYGLFQRLYRIIGCIILIAGLALTPFIHYFAADYAQLNVDLRITFVLMLLSVVITYFFGAKTSLFNAYKDNYITTAITSGGIVLQYILQIVALLLTRSFEWYLVCRIAAAMFQWLITEIISKKKHADIACLRAELDTDTKKELTKNIKAVFMHKIGELLVNTVDSIIISAFIGVVVLGKYSNYNTIMVSMTGVISLLFTSLTSVLGHFYAQSDKQKLIRYFDTFHTLNFVVGLVFYLGYYAVADDLVGILFSEDLIVEETVRFVITLNGFVQFMRNSALTFRSAAGLFYYDRWKPLLEGLVNIVLSILFVRWIGVTGVIVATVLTNLLICHVVEPHVLYKHAFLHSAKKYYFKNYGMIAVFVGALALLRICMRSLENDWLDLLCNGCISVGISAVICLVILLTNRDVLALILRKGKGV